MSATISSADEYKEAAQRARFLSDSQEGTLEAAEADDLAGAIRKWDDSQNARDERADMNDHASERSFPISAGILFGLGLGGFFDGIILHQILQWHQMLSSWFPPTTIENIKLNTFWDGVFHSATYLFVVAGLFMLWNHAHRRHLYWSNKLLAGTMLVGFGAFNCVEGLIDHHLLGVHHVNETVSEAARIYWDIGFLVWGAAMLIGGWIVIRSGKKDVRAQSGRT